MRRARRRIPRYAAALLALACLLAAGLRASTSTTSANTGQAWLVDPPITYAQLQSQAEALTLSQSASDPNQTSLVELITRSLQLPPGTPPGRRLVEMAWTVELGVPSGRETLRAIGWPMPWITISRYYAYSDSFFMTGLKPSVTDPALRAFRPSRYGPPFYDVRRVPPYPRFQWFGDMVRYQLPPEETGGYPTITSVYFFNIAGTLGLMAALWYLAFLLFALARPAIRKPRHERVLRRARFFPLALTLLVTAFIIIRAAWVSEARYRGLPFSSRNGAPSVGPGAARLSFDADQLAALRGPEGDRALAAAILNQIPAPQQEPKDDSVLVVGWYPEFHSSKLSVTSFDLGPFIPLGWAYRTTYTVNPAVTDPGPFQYQRGLGMQIQRVGVLRYSSGRPDKPTYTLVVDLARFGFVIISIWLTWLVTRCLIIVSQRTRLRRRARGGLCLNCRYPLPVFAP